MSSYFETEVDSDTKTTVPVHITWSTCYNQDKLCYLTVFLLHIFVSSTCLSACLTYTWLQLSPSKHKTSDFVYSHSLCSFENTPLAKQLPICLCLCKTSTESSHWVQQNTKYLRCCKTTSNTTQWCMTSFFPLLDLFYYLCIRLLQYGPEAYNVPKQFIY